MGSCWWKLLLLSLPSMRGAPTALETRAEATHPPRDPNSHQGNAEKHLVLHHSLVIWNGEEGKPQDEDRGGEKSLQASLCGEKRPQLPPSAWPVLPFMTASGWASHKAPRRDPAPHALVHAPGTVPAHWGRWHCYSRWQGDLSKLHTTHVKGKNHVPIQQATTPPRMQVHQNGYNQFFVCFSVWDKTICINNLVKLLGFLSLSFSSLEHIDTTIITSMQWYQWKPLISLQWSDLHRFSFISNFWRKCRVLDISVFPNCRSLWSAGSGWKREQL